jgi:hypothetical protein
VYVYIINNANGVTQMSTETREERQAKITARVAELRAAADKKNAEANRILGNVITDYAFWTQPAYGNAAGRSFARQRDRERAKRDKACEIHAEAEALRTKADAMESRGAVVAGDAQSRREKIIASVEVQAGQIVNTTFYGLRKVLKVNAKSVLVEGSFGPLKVEKQYVRAV